jgi:hypothetical protein
MATIGNLFVRIGADTKPMEKSLAEAKGRVSQWATSIGGIAMGAGGMLASILPGDLGAGAARVMSAMQGIANVAQSGSKVVGQFGGAMTLLANPMTAVVLGGAAVAVAVAAVGTALVMATLKAAKLGDQLKETADELGTTAENFQRLEYVGTAAGAGPEKIKTSITKMQFALANAAQGSAEASKSFEKLGLDVGKLSTMDATKAFEEIIGKIRELPTHTEKVKALRDIFGKGGTGLAGMVKLSAEELDQLNKEAAAFTIKEGSVQALASLQDSVDTLGLAFERLMAEVMAPLAPMIQMVTDTIKDMLAQNADSLVSGMSEFVMLVAEGLDAVRPLWEGFMGIYNVLQSINGFLMGSILRVLSEVVGIVANLIELLNYIPGIEIPTKGFERASELMRRISDKGFAAAAQDMDDAAERFSTTGTLLAQQAAGQAGSFALAALAFEKARREATADPATASQAAPPAIVDPEQLKRAEEVAKILEKMRDDAEKIGKTDAQLLEAQLSKLGATSAQIQEALQLQQQMTDAKAAEEAAAEQAKQQEKLAARLDDMRRKVDDFGKSADELAAAQLRSLGATQEQIDEAIRLQQELTAMESAAKNAAEIESILADVTRAADEAGKSEAELMRMRLEALGATQDQIEAAMGALRDTQVGNILRDLEDQAKRATMSERELLEEKLRAAGATAEEIERGLALQEQIDAAKAKDGKSGGAGGGGGPDSVQTALGSIKLPGMVDSVKLAEEQLDVGYASVEMLERIAGATEASALATAAAQPGGSHATGERLEDQTVSILKQIEANTRAFAGVLT